MKVALFPGSFDPFTNGHLEIIKRALLIFDKIIVGVGNNTTKQYMFPVEVRVQCASYATASMGERVVVTSYSGLTVDFCRQMGIKVIIRGVRTQADFQFEYDIAVNNSALAPDIQTVLIPAPPHVSHIRSTIIREIYMSGGDISGMVPPEVLKVLTQKTVG